MLRLTRKAEYGIIALTFMANRPLGEVTSAKEIAATFNIPQELMAKTLQKLVKHGLIESVQGAHGGYVLAKKAQDISLAAVIEALEGPVNLVECIAEDQTNCSQMPHCNIIDPFKIIQDAFHRFLTAISLADLNNETELRRIHWRPLNVRTDVATPAQLISEQS
jgi:Rrf2 family protein